MITDYGKAWGIEHNSRRTLLVIASWARCINAQDGSVQPLEESQHVDVHQSASLLMDKIPGVGQGR